MVIAAAIVSFGLLIGRRIFLHIDDHQIFDAKTSSWSWNAFILIQISLFIAIHEHSLLLWCLELGTLAIPFSIYFFQDRARRASFFAQLVPLLDLLLLQMRSGRTLKDSLGMASDGFPRIRFLILEIESLLQFETTASSNFKDPLFLKVANELSEIHRTPMKAAERLKSFRNRIKTEQDFRHKSGQVTAQIRMQAAVLGTLYLILMFYVLYSHPFREIRNLIFLSVFLFMLGLCLLFLIPRRFKWKI